MRRLWRDFGLSITLALMFFISLALQTWMGWNNFAAEQRTLGETPTAFGEGGYIWHWGEATFENWQSEFVQLLTFVVLTTILVHRRSHESPDTDYDTEATLRRLEAKIDALQAKVGNK